MKIKLNMINWYCLLFMYCIAVKRYVVPDIGIELNLINRGRKLRQS